VSDPFIPFTLAGGSPTSQAFAPKAAPLQVPAASANHAAYLSDPAATSELTLVRDGDRVTAIRVLCACGTVHEIQCEY
jgi:hypothetical protein